MESISFYAHHSAFGAFSSFIVGKLGKGGGVVLNDVHPPNNNVYVGYKQGKKIKLLPFLKVNSIRPEEAFTGEKAKNNAKYDIEFFSEKEINREMGWASDTWIADKLRFSIITPFGYVNSPEAMEEKEKKLAFAPVIFIQLTMDNRGNKLDTELIFGLEGTKRLLSDTMDSRYLGIAFDRKYGFATWNSEDVREYLRLSLLDSWGNDIYQNHRLGKEGALLFKVPAGEIRTYTIVLATYQDGIITTGIETEFYYTTLFKSLEDVLEFGLKNANYYLDMAKQRDKELRESGLNEYRQFLIAYATHAYYANSQLMTRKDGVPLWIVNEGEYLMINTFDLTIDHLFWELKFHPWTIKNTLDLYVEKYSYFDQAGRSFTHDMGVANNFSPQGYSSYELPNLHGVFSYMTHEELLNWIITGAVYAFKTNDNEWLEQNLNVFVDCLNSLVARDKNNDGIMDVDTSRCENGSEITTYDSLDVSLGQARNNLYLGVKTWAAYVLLNKIFKEYNLDDYAAASLKKAQQAASTIVSKFDEQNRYIPAVFEQGNTSRIIPAIEALIYPYYIGDVDTVSETGPFKELIIALKHHIVTVLKPGCCIDPISGGWKLSSTSKNTWNSKIFLSQHIVKKILRLDFGDKEIEWDRVHTRWQQISCSEEGPVDQVNSDNGTARGSRLYPRLVTSILWMEE